MESRLRVAHISATALMALILAWGWIDGHIVRPVPFYSWKSDPEIGYLLNSLSVFKGYPYVYIDHPGTPVEVIGTILIGLTRLARGSSSGPVVVQVLEEPGDFLGVAHGLVTLGSVASVVLISMRAVRVRTWTDLLVALAAAGAFYALFPTATPGTLSKWSHDAFIFPGGTMVLLAILIRIRSEKRLEAWESWAFGGATGWLTAVQLYFSTWAIGAVIALGGYRLAQEKSRLRCLVTGAQVVMGCLVGFFIATGPIIHKYHDLWSWIWNLVIHQGRYGTGPEGIVSKEQILSNLGSLFSYGALPLASMGIALALLLGGTILYRRESQRSNGWMPLALGLSLQVLATFALILKHPGSTYLMALVAVIPVAMALALPIYARLGNAFPSVLSAAVLMMFLNSMRLELQSHRRLAASVQQSEAEVQQHLGRAATRAGKAAGALTILWGYGAPSRCYALRFGDSFTGGVFAKEIDELCPNNWIFDIWGEKAYLPSGPVSLSESSEWDLLVVPTDHIPGESASLGNMEISADGNWAFIEPPSRPNR